MSPLRQLRFSNVQAVISPEIVDFGQVAFLFLPYLKPGVDGIDGNEEYVKKAKGLLDDQSKMIVAFTHLNVDGAVINDEHILRPIKTVIPKRLFNRRGVRLVLSGHIHRPQKVETGTHVHHHIIGSPVCTDFGDMAKKSFIVVNHYEDDVVIERVAPTTAVRLVELTYNVHKKTSPRLVLEDKTRTLVTGCGVKVKVTCLEGQVGELGLREFEHELSLVAKFVRPIVPVVLRQRDEKFKVISGSMTDEEAVKAWISSRKPANEDLVEYHALKAVEDVG